MDRRLVKLYLRNWRRRRGKRGWGVLSSFRRRGLRYGFNSLSRSVLAAFAVSVYVYVSCLAGTQRTMITILGRRGWV
jgi:hypothetical protein